MLEEEMNVILKGHTLNANEAELEQRYSKIYNANGAPNWALDIEPAIPFVGDCFIKTPVKCLIYGSAENLTYLSGRKVTLNNYLRNRQTTDTNNFFKKIHITPIMSWFSGNWNFLMSELTYSVKGEFNEKETTQLYARRKSNHTQTPFGRQNTGFGYL